MWGYMQARWRILEPIQLGKTLCKNRILMAAHSYGYVDSAGLPTEYLVDYLAERAKGGVGLVIMGGTSVSQEGALVERMTVNTSDDIVPWYQRIAEEVHKHGALVFDQLMHIGGQLDAREGARIVAPSSVPHECTKGIPLELTIDEIQTIVSDFAKAAQRAKLGKMDGIELKCDQGFLIQQFLSPYYNRRSDKYGGTYEKRLQFLVEILEEVRGAVGSDFVVGIRITGDALAPGDLTINDAIKIVQDIESTGYIDYIHVNAATNSSYRGYLIGHGDSSIEPMNFAPIARAIKGVVSLPVIVASMITHPSEAEFLVTSGAADMVAMTRAHIADADIVNKVKDGRIDDIRPCVLCNQGCVGNHWKGLDVRCIHNPATGRERELGSGTIVKVTEPRRITVIGGGPAGLEVARVAALRGHRVELFEKQGLLGGQVLLASKLPYRQGLLDIVYYLQRQLSTLGVDIHRGVNVSIEDVMSDDQLDILVIATGAEPFIPPIYQEVDPSSMVNIRDALEGNIDLGEHILVIDLDWRQNLLGVAEWLLQRGRKVTVISSTFYIGEGLDVATRTSYYSRLHKSVRFLPLTDLMFLKNRVAGLRNVTSNAIEEIYPIDQVVFVTGAKPVTELYYAVRDKLSNVFRVGDCVNPLGIPEAMLEANRLARTL